MYYPVRVNAFALRGRQLRVWRWWDGGCHSCLLWLLVSLCRRQITQQDVICPTCAAPWHVKHLKRQEARLPSAGIAHPADCGWECPRCTHSCCCQTDCERENENHRCCHLRRKQLKERLLVPTGNPKKHAAPAATSQRVLFSAQSVKRARTNGPTVVHSAAVPFRCVAAPPSRALLGGRGGGLPPRATLRTLRSSSFEPNADVAAAVTPTVAAAALPVRVSAVPSGVHVAPRVPSPTPSSVRVGASRSAASPTLNGSPHPNWGVALCGEDLLNLESLLLDGAKYGIGRSKSTLAAFDAVDDECCSPYFSFAEFSAFDCCGLDLPAGSTAVAPSGACPAADSAATLPSYNTLSSASVGATALAGVGAGACAGVAAMANCMAKHEANSAIGSPERDRLAAAAAAAAAVPVCASPLSSGDSPFQCSPQGVDFDTLLSVGECFEWGAPDDCDDAFVVPSVALADGSQRSDGTAAVAPTTLLPSPLHSVSPTHCAPSTSSSLAPEAVVPLPVSSTPAHLPPRCPSPATATPSLGPVLLYQCQCGCWRTCASSSSSSAAPVGGAGCGMGVLPPCARLLPAVQLAERVSAAMLPGLQASARVCHDGAAQSASPSSSSSCGAGASEVQWNLVLDVGGCACPLGDGQTLQDLRDLEFTVRIHRSS